MLRRLLVFYLAALAVLFVSAFWSVDPFTGELVQRWTTDNFRTLWEAPAYRTIALRTIGIAAAVTITDALIAFPFAFFMARIASRRTRALLFVLVLLPLWSSYLVRVYAWRLLLAKNGAINWSLGKLRLPELGVAYSNTAMWIVFSYIWLPFMILPIYAALERIPHSYLEASGDLGARGGRDASLGRAAARPAGHRRRLDLHLLADARRLHHAGAGRRRVLAVHRQRRLRVGRRPSNVPFAAAFATVPLAVMAVYLVVARRLGAFEAL